MIEIKHKTTNAVLHRVHADTLNHAYLRAANLRDANLRGARISTGQQNLLIQALGVEVTP